MDQCSPRTHHKDPEGTTPHQRSSPPGHQRGHGLSAGLRRSRVQVPALIDEILAQAGIQTVLTGIRMPRMNAIMERWVQSCCRDLLDRCLLWNEHHLRHALREYEQFYNRHRAHQALAQAAPLRPVPDPITDPERITSLTIRRRDRLGGILHEYSHAA
ncbi:integrase core domain-containing protein [Herbidospora mongoliensis]|uniref:integrase core domain-containing protein n=1 Tax=Herbidospora mongoliensis TaxID=688067 RepID=UPI000A00DB72|nr:integrase core domain-containing protein [Herbidospora mongoliensis]